MNDEEHDESPAFSGGPPELDEELVARVSSASASWLV